MKDGDAILKWKARAAELRRAVLDLTGTDTKDRLPDLVLAAIAARAEALADLAAGSSETLRTRGEVVGVARAAAVALAADVVAMLRLVIESDQAERFDRQMIEQAERLEAKRVARLAGPGGGAPPGETIN